MRGAWWPVGFVVLWSSGFVGAVLAEPAGSVAGVLAWRYVVTAVVLVAAVVVLRRPAPRPRDLAQQAVLGVLAHVVFLGGVFGATAGRVDAGTVALVCALQPMLVTAVGALAWGDRVPARRLVGLLVGLGAVAVTVGGGAGGEVVTFALPVAALLGLSGAALLERRWHPQVDVVTSLAVQVAVAAVVFLGWAAATGSLAVPVTGPVVGALVWLVVLSGIGGYAAFVTCLRRLGATTTSSLLYLTPAVTTLWAWAMFDQVPGVIQWAGLGLGAIAVGLTWTRPEDPRFPALLGPDAPAAAPTRA